MKRLGCLYIAYIRKYGSKTQVIEIKFEQDTQYEI